jgi:uncharacterized protein (TIGR02217 family)
MAIPDFSWSSDPVVLEEVFPEDISSSSEVSQVFSTSINETDDGSEGRIGHWDQPLHEYDVSYGVRTMEQLADLRRMFRMARGQLYGLLIIDPLEHTSSTATEHDARREPSASPLDQTLAASAVAQTAFQLSKTYGSGTYASVRYITRPVGGSVRLAVNGVELVQGVGFTVSLSTGVVTTASPVTGLVTAGFQFYVPVRFAVDRLPVRLEHYGIGSTSIPLREIRFYEGGGV